MMILFYQMTREDYIQYNLDVMEISPSLRRSTAIMKWSLPLLYLTMPFFLTNMSPVPFYFWAVVFFIIGLIWLLTFPGYMKRSATKKINKLLDEGKNVSFIGDHTLHLQADHLIDITPHGENRLSWKAVERLVETDAHLYVFLSPMLALVLPKRYMGVEGGPTVDGMKMALTGFTQKQWETKKS